MDVPAGVKQEEGHTGFFIHLLSVVHALIFLARRIQPFLSLVDREVEFCVLTILIILHPLCCCCCCCCLHIKSRSGLYSVLSNIGTGPTDADAFRGHRLTTQKGYTYQKEIKGPRKVSTHAIV